MFQRMGFWYSRRVVNVNVNIVTAGILALAPTLIAVHLVELGLTRETALGRHLAAHHKVVISGVTFLTDVVSDVFIYYALHFLANHWPKALKYRPQDAQHTQVPFFRDATIVQFQRMILSPLLYTIWLVTQQVLMQTLDMSSVWATAIGCIFAIATIRTIHTAWMIQAAKRKLVQGAQLLHDLTPFGKSPTGGVDAEGRPIPERRRAQRPSHPAKSQR